MASNTTSVSRTIRADRDRVFDTVAHIENFCQAVPHIVEIEFLTDQHRGKGTRFRETRLMGKRRSSCVLEVAEYEPNHTVRMVTDAGGTIWDTVFHVEPTKSGDVELRVVMEAKAYRLLAKLVNPLIKGMVRRAVEKDMDAVKVWCEGGVA